MELLRKSGLSAILVMGLSTNVFAQNFTFSSVNQYLVVQLYGHPLGYQTNESFADFNSYLNSSNALDDYYVADQDTVLTPTQLICNTYINLQGTVPPSGPGANAGSYCEINFSVSSPVTADFAFSNFSISDSGISYDGTPPTIGIIGPQNYLFNNQTDGSIELTFEPDNTYTFFEQMTGFGSANPSGESVDVAWQANMSLTIVPEPSSALFLGVGLTALFQFRRLRQRSK